MFLLLSSCNTLTEIASKTVEVKAPAINFSIGGSASAPQQKVIAGVLTEVVWLDQSIDIKTVLTDKLTEIGFALPNLKKLTIIASEIDLKTTITKTYNLGDVKIYVNNVAIAHASGVLSPTNNTINLTYDAPYSLYEFINLGTVQLKITSTAAVPDIKLDLSLLNTYSANISLL
jgi:hypothetical protein